MDRYALCIGLNYPNTSAQLAGCVNDMNDWSAELANRGYSVDRLWDNDATKSNIIRAIAKLVDDLEYGDIGIITYSGHGSWVPDENGDEPDKRDECLCPADIFDGNYIIDDEIDAILKQKKHGARIGFISDSCHSGTVTRAKPRIAPGGVSVAHIDEGYRAIRFLAPSAFIKSRSLSRVAGFVKASPPGRHIALLISGCADYEYSYDAWFGGRANGAFTYAALRALKQLSPDATFWDWWRKIRETLPSEDYPQTPNLYGRSDMKAWKIT